MSQQNVDLVRSTLERFISEEEIDWDRLDEKVVMSDHDLPEHPEYHGHNGFLRWLRDWSEAWAEWAMTPQEYIDAGDRVVVLLHMVATGRGSGLKVERDDALVYELRDGKMVRMDYFNSRQQAFEFAGVSPEAEPAPQS